MHPSKKESLPNPLDISSVAQEYSQNNINKKKFSVDKHFRSPHLKEGRSFVRTGYDSLNLIFTADEEEQLNECMKRIREQSRAKDQAAYNAGHIGHIISKEKIDSVLPLALRRALLTQDLVRRVEHYFGVAESLTLFALEAHEVPPFASEQTDHSDVTLNEARMSEDIRRLAVTCIISIKGPVTTMVYPMTAARIQSEDELAERHCIRATEDKNCVLFDASLAHKGSANNSSEPILRFVFTFIQTSATRRQSKWVQQCTGVKKPLNLSVAQFIGATEKVAALPAAAVPAEDPVAATAAAAGSTVPSPSSAPGQLIPSPPLLSLPRAPTLLTAAPPPRAGPAAVTLQETSLEVLAAAAAASSPDATVPLPLAASQRPRRRPSCRRP